MFDEIGEYMNSQKKNPLLFRRKPGTVEAFQMTYFRMEDNTQWPQWLHEAWNKDRPSLGCLYRNRGGELYLVVHDGARDVNQNDWIVQDSEGELVLYTSESFEELYEKA